MAERPLVALAGATGFLGRRLADRLAAAGWRVRALVRRAEDRAALTAAGFEVMAGDLADEPALRRLVVGAEAAINCAGLIKARKQAEYFRANRDGAERFAAVHGGRSVLVSSLAAREPQLSDYAASKRAGEEAARGAAGGPLAILRPPAIYGPGDRETLSLFRLARWSPFAPVPGDARARLALAHVDDVVAAIVDLAARTDLCGTYAVGGDRPEGYGWGEIAQAAWRAMGRQARPVRIPNWCLGSAAVAVESIAAAGNRASIFNRGKAREMAHGDWSVTLAEAIPGAPDTRFTLEAGFADTVAWYRTQGWL
ncbi:MAG TPA: NAD-dependent epimerase/dehydratase family protein [Caulobacteraceae bacterium]|jgi:nucleoside-diphosphate-sugar epimerase